MGNVRHRVATLALTVAGFGAGAAFTSGASAQAVTPPPNPAAVGADLRGEGGSRHDLRHVEHRLRRIIADLNRDQRDYGGHRANAVNLLQQAEGELQQALQYDAAHPGR